uniref:Uncharacterized protein n=1 Tax=Arundo donax TaxID=35708 RepID=A0A0A9CT82_ARUDO
MGLHARSYPPSGRTLQTLNEVCCKHMLKLQLNSSLN